MFQALRDLGPDASFDSISEYERRIRDPNDRAVWLMERMQIVAEVWREKEPKPDGERSQFPKAK